MFLWQLGYAQQYVAQKHCGTVGLAVAVDSVKLVKMAPIKKL